MEPQFLSGDVTDEQLQVDFAALAAGHCSGWRLSGEAAYEATQGAGTELVLYRFRRIWLFDSEGKRKDVTLQRLLDPPVWRRVAVPGEDAP